jgi:transposase InsO family protein
VDWTNTSNAGRRIINRELHQGIVFRFGVPNNIVTNSGSNFTSREFKEYCEGVGIKL